MLSCQELGVSSNWSRVLQDDIGRSGSHDKTSRVVAISHCHLLFLEDISRICLARIFIVHYWVFLDRRKSRTILERNACLLFADHVSQDCVCFDTSYASWSLILWGSLAEPLRLVARIIDMTLAWLLGPWDICCGGQRAAFWRVHAGVFGAISGDPGVTHTSHHQIIRVSHWKPCTTAYNCRVFTLWSSNSGSLAQLLRFHFLILRFLSKPSETSHNMTSHATSPPVPSRYILLTLHHTPYHTSYQAAHYISQCTLKHASHFTSDQISRHDTSHHITAAPERKICLRQDNAENAEMRRKTSQGRQMRLNCK